MKLVANVLSYPSDVVVVPVRIGYRKAVFHIRRITGNHPFKLYIEQNKDTFHVIRVHSQQSISAQLPFDLQLIEEPLYHQVIPRKLLLFKDSEWLRVLNPEYECTIIRPEAHRAFIERRYGQLLVDAYDALEHHRNTIFIYAYLYAKGGVYIDSSLTLLKPLREIVGQRDELHLCESNKEAIESTLVFTKAESPILKSIINAYKRLTIEDKFHDITPEKFVWSVIIEYCTPNELRMHKDLQGIIDYTNRLLATCD